MIVMNSVDQICVLARPELGMDLILMFRFF